MLRLGIGACLLAFTFGANAAHWSPHVGLDYKYWDLEPRVEFEELFPRVQWAYNGYVGSRINSFVGFDLGFEYSHLQDRYVVFDGTENYFAQPEAVNNAAHIPLRIYTSHLALNFYWEIWHRFEAIFMMGAAYTKFKTHIFHVDALTGAEVEYRNKTHARWFGRIGIGAQYNILPCTAIKAMFVFDPGQRITYAGQNPANQNFHLRPYHHTTSFNIGVVYSFSDNKRGRPKMIKRVDDGFYRD